jgi:lipid A ethanolaminephosphotransferase
MQREFSSVQLIAGAALFMVASGNLAFFRNVLATFGHAPLDIAHTASLALVQLCALLVLASLVAWGRALKPVLAALFVLTALAAYFMDSYNVIVDADMLSNVLATDAAEVADLLTPRLFSYLLLLGVSPALLLARLRLRPDPPVAALRARALLAGGALLLTLALGLLSSGFYASFIREHKALRYYSNPATPLYAVYKLARSRAAGEPGALRPIGEDVRRPTEDHARELVLLVVGETARADRFSLNGYTRETNPRLAAEDVASLRRVSACGTATAISVPCMFSALDRAGFSKTRAQTSENLLDLLQRAGVKVLWRDNNAGSKGVADRVKNEDFRNPQRNPLCDAECRDLGMLDGLQAFIDAQPDGDILIVLHQMGSHGPAYHRRYPPAFHVFSPTCESSQLDDCDHAAIGNSYDNSIRYTDHFLAEVIALLRANDGRFETAMLYVGDHGESLGEAGVYLHGLPYLIAPEAQTRVPMILWFGEHNDDAATADLRLLRDVELSHDNLFHTVLGLFEISSKVYDPAKDLLRQAAQRAGRPHQVAGG